MKGPCRQSGSNRHGDGLACLGEVPEAGTEEEMKSIARLIKQRWSRTCREKSR